MLTKRIQSFFHAHRLLTQLRSVKRALDSGTMPTPHDLQPLVGLQRLLSREIWRSERKIRRCKALLRAGSLSAERVSELGWRIDGFRSDAFLWRSFGDAIAFLFLDKHALKHTYYSVEAPTEKQVAGFLDKEGASNEWAELERLTDLGIPVLLTDLTNVIRHGDSEKQSPTRCTRLVRYFIVEIAPFWIGVIRATSWSHKMRISRRAFGLNAKSVRAPVSIKCWVGGYFVGAASRDACSSDSTEIAAHKGS